MTSSTEARPLAGRCAVITGASRGLGLAIAERFVDAGASVMICARDASALSDSRAALLERASAGQVIAARAGDASQPGEADAAIADALAAFGRLDILVSNAGILGPVGGVHEVSWQDWVRTVEVNLLASVLFCRAVLPHFRAQRRGKIIQLSGGGATRPLPALSAYAASKAAVVRFMETLAEETRGLGIDVNAIAPGVLNTRMLEQVLAAGRERLGGKEYDALREQKRSGGVPLARGAELAVFLASAASDGITGRLLSAVWDPWSSLPHHAEELAASDVYTLRRIVPKDRGLDWEDDA